MTDSVNCEALSDGTIRDVTDEILPAFAWALAGRLQRLTGFFLAGFFLAGFFAAGFFAGALTRTGLAV